MFFEGLQKISILELANGKGGQLAHSQGYPVLAAHALALRVSRERYVAALRHARGDLSEKWANSLSEDEKNELNRDAPSDTTYVSFDSPMSAKKRKRTGDTDRAIDATPLKGEDLFGGETQKRGRIPKKQYINDEPGATSHAKSKRKKQEDHVSEDEEEELEYEDKKETDLSLTNREKYWDKVGHLFEDTEDKIRFKILSICTSSDPNLGIFYKYRDISANEGEDAEFTPCAELLRAKWVRWLE
jgi:hypothetical protein